MDGFAWALVFKLKDGSELPGEFKHRSLGPDAKADLNRSRNVLRIHISNSLTGDANAVGLETTFLKATGLEML